MNEHSIRSKQTKRIDRDDLDQQVEELTDCFETMTRAVVPDTVEIEIKTTLHEAKALDLLGRLRVCTITEFAKALNVTLSTASHTADRLATQRALKQTRSSQDRRVVMVSLSGKGLKRHEALLKRRQEAVRGLLMLMAEEERTLAVRALRHLAEAAQGVPSPAPADLRRGL